MLEAVGVRPFGIRLQVVARICRGCADNAPATGGHNLPVDKLTVAGMVVEEKCPRDMPSLLRCQVHALLQETEAPHKRKLQDYVFIHNVAPVEVS